MDPPPAVADLRRRPAAADVVVFSTPEYAGSLENALDRVVGSGELHREPVARIAVGAPYGEPGRRVLDDADRQVTLLERSLRETLGADAAVLRELLERVAGRRDRPPRAPRCC